MPVDQLVVLAGVHLLRVVVGPAGGAGRDGEGLVPVVQLQPALALDEAQVVHAAVGPQVVVADHGDAQPLAGGVPVDVEGVRVLGATAVLEDVPPPRVGGRRRDPDVVGHDVDQHAHAQRTGRR